MDDYGNTLVTPDSFWGFVWGPFGLHYWAQIGPDEADFI